MKLTRNGTPDEDLMLAEAFHVEDNSRLGCQIQMTPEFRRIGSSTSSKSLIYYC